MMTFQKYTKIKADLLLNRYPDRIPIICEVVKDSQLPELDKKKYLVPKDLTIGQFLYIIRKRLKLSPEKALFIFVGKNVSPPISALVSEIYDKYKDQDEFLYVLINGENVFG